MPKAKIKTKGVAKDNLSKAPLTRETAPAEPTKPVADISADAAPPTVSASPVQKARRKVKNHNYDSICKSKDLTEKRQRKSRAHRSARHSEAKPPRCHRVSDDDVMQQMFDSDENTPLGLLGHCPATTTQTVHHHDTISHAEDVPPSPSHSGISRTVINVPVDTSLAEVAPPETKIKNTKSHTKPATEPIHSGITKTAVKRSLSDEGPPAKRMTKDAPNIIQATLKVKINNVENTHGQIKFDCGLTWGSDAIRPPPSHQPSSSSPNGCSPPVPSTSHATDSEKTESYYEDCDNLSPATSTHKSNRRRSTPNSTASQDADSERTEPYDYGSISPASTHGSSGKSFSPIPSTSRDNEAFEKNDLLLNESLRIDDDVEVIEVPCETIVLDDNTPDRPTHETIDITSRDAQHDDDVQLVSCYTIPKCEPAPEYDPTSLENFLFGRMFSDGDNIDNSDCEIVDVDSVIAENNALLEKYKRKNTPVTTVVAAPVRPTLQLERAESPTQLTDLDLTTNMNERYNITGVNEGGGEPSHPVAISSPMQDCVPDPETGTNVPTISGIIDTYFKTNPVSLVKAPINCICSTLNNILDNVTNILNGDTNAQEEAGTSVARQKNKQQINSYANSLAVVDTVDLDASQPPVYLQPPYHYPVTVLHVPTQVNTYAQMNTPAQSSSRPDSTYSQVNTTTTTAVYNIPVQNMQISNKPTPEKSPTKKNNSNKDMLMERECPICMESLGSKPLASTICGHIFCMVCIQKAVNTPGGKKCPTCRKSLKKGQGYHPLFI